MYIAVTKFKTGDSGTLELVSYFNNGTTDRYDYSDPESKELTYSRSSVGVYTVGIAIQHKNGHTINVSPVGSPLTPAVPVATVTANSTKNKVITPYVSSIVFVKNPDDFPHLGTVSTVIQFQNVAQEFIDPSDFTIIVYVDSN